VRIWDAEEYGLPSMSVKSTPKFEIRLSMAEAKVLGPRDTEQWIYGCTAKNMSILTSTHT